MDQHLKWKEHTEYLTTRIRKLTYLFYQIREFLNKKTITMIYRALVESILNYAITIWGGTYKNAVNHLSTCQNSIIKVIFKKEKLFPTLKLYNETELLNIKYLYIKACIIFTHFNKHLYPQHSHLYETRNKKNPLSMRTQKTQCQHFISFTGPKYYNKVPSNIKQTKNPKTFKKILHEYIIQNKNIFM